MAVQGESLDTLERKEEAVKREEGIRLRLGAKKGVRATLWELKWSDTTRKF